MSAQPDHIVVDADGFAIIDHGRHRRARWADIVEVVAFKQDLVTTDRLCIEFRCSGGGNALIVHEDMPGFALLDQTLPVALPSLQPAWRGAVLLPAFAANSTVIFRREGR
jgi:hypothetical protein